MNVTKSGLLVGFVIGSVVFSGLWGYVHYYKINTLEDQINELEQTYRERERVY
jgi:hypothetical protein